MPDAELAEVVHMELRGGVFVCALFAPALTPVMPVGRPGKYAVEVSVAGRSTLVRRVEAGAVDRPSGVERFRVAFWPSEG
jgi:hypothetical protein